MLKQDRLLQTFKIDSMQILNQISNLYTVYTLAKQSSRTFNNGSWTLGNSFLSLTKLLFMVKCIASKNEQMF